MAGVLVVARLDARAPGFGNETPFDFPFPAAAKTGTSRHFTDNWAVGVTRGFTVAVWVGYDDALSIENEDVLQSPVEGVEEAAAFMRPILA